MRGISGSGKSTLAEKLGTGGIILSVDNYFQTDEGYKFDPEKIGDAHVWNQRNALEAMQKGISPIVIDNTSVQAWESKPYVEMGLKHGYQIEFQEPETPWKFNAEELAQRNKHGVTKEVIQEMIDKWDSNLTVKNVLDSEWPEDVKKLSTFNLHQYRTAQETPKESWHSLETKAKHHGLGGRQQSESTVWLYKDGGKWIFYIQDTPGQWYLNTLLNDHKSDGIYIDYGMGWICDNIQELLKEAKYLSESIDETSEYGKPIPVSDLEKELSSRARTTIAQAYGDAPPPPEDAQAIEVKDQHGNVIEEIEVERQYSQNVFRPDASGRYGNYATVYFVVKITRPPDQVTRIKMRQDQFQPFVVGHIKKIRDSFKEEHDLAVEFGEPITPDDIDDLLGGNDEQIKTANKIDDLATFQLMKLKTPGKIRIKDKIIDHVMSIRRTGESAPGVTSFQLMFECDKDPIPIPRRYATIEKINGEYKLIDPFLSVQLLNQEEIMNEIIDLGTEWVPIEEFEKELCNKSWYKKAQIDAYDQEFADIATEVKPHTWKVYSHELGWHEELQGKKYIFPDFIIILYDIPIDISILAPDDIEHDLLYDFRTKGGHYNVRRIKEEDNYYDECDIPDTPEQRHVLAMVIKEYLEEKILQEFGEPLTPSEIEEEI